MPESGKERKDHIEPGYYRRRDAIARRRRAIVALVLIGTMAWLILAPSWGRGRAVPSRFVWKQIASHGDLARAHAQWDSRCEACHIPAVPVNGSRWAPLQTGSRAADDLCLACHPAANHPGGTDRATPIPAEVVACAECHRDHRGRDASLVQMDDLTCTRCHADLDSHRQGQATIDPHVGSFPSGHPPFQERDDPSPIRFHHARHLAPGMPTPGGGPVLTYAQLAPEDRPRFGGKPAMTDAELQAPVALDCAMCHRTDAAGAYMLPLSYENNCRACHPLGYDPSLPDRTMPHGLQPAEVIGELNEVYRAVFALTDPAQLRRPLPPRPRPDRPAEGATVEPKQIVDERVAAAVRKLFITGADDSPADRGGCLLCHRMEPPFTAAHIDPPGGWFAQPGGAPTPWFARATFSHEAHRYVACLDCHEGVNTSEQSTELHMPEIAQCARCHHRDDSLFTLRGDPGASSSCTECHRYHPHTQAKAVGLPLSPRTGRGQAAQRPGEGSASGPVRTEDPSPQPSPRGRGVGTGPP